MTASALSAGRRELARRGYVARWPSPPRVATDGVRTRFPGTSSSSTLLAYGISQMGTPRGRSAQRRPGARRSRTGSGTTSVGLDGHVPRAATRRGTPWPALPWLASRRVPICGGVGQLESVIRGGDLYRHSAYFYVPHMLRYFDHPEIVAHCIAPRPFMMVAPTSDEDMPRSPRVDELDTCVVAPAFTATPDLSENISAFTSRDGNHCLPVRVLRMDGGLVRPLSQGHENGK